MTQAVVYDFNQLKPSISASRKEIDHISTEHNYDSNKLSQFTSVEHGGISSWKVFFCDVLTIQLWCFDHPMILVLFNIRMNGDEVTL